MTYLLNSKTDYILKNSAICGRIFIIFNLAGALKIILCGNKNREKFLKSGEKLKKDNQLPVLDNKFSLSYFRVINPIKKQTP